MSILVQYIVILIAGWTIIAAFAYNFVMSDST